MQGTFANEWIASLWNFQNITWLHEGCISKSVQCKEFLLVYIEAAGDAIKELARHDSVR
jgi:hypothetical protein